MRMEYSDYSTTDELFHRLFYLNEKKADVIAFLLLAQKLHL